MSKKTGYLLGILLTIILGTILCWYLCCKPCLEADKVAIDNTINTEDVSVKTDQKTATINVFAVKDVNGDLDFQINDNLNFKTSSPLIIDSITSSVGEGANKLVAYYNSNPNKLLNIYGHYRSDEVNNSVFPDLGLARANAAKNYFVSKGMASKNINTYGKLDDNFNANAEGVLQGPLSYEVQTVAAGDTSIEEDTKKLGDTIKADPLILYFDTAQATISLSDSQRLKVSNMVKYIDKVDGALITVTGFTDNTGSRPTNIKLGQGRADFTKQYLIQNGIDSSKIQSFSKGPDLPIADNATEEGRAKNRRVEVTIN